MNESRRLTHKYAKIRISTRRCMGVLSSEEVVENNALYEYLEISTLNEDYIGKYYIDGSWYEDAAGTIPWSPEE